MTQIRRRFRIDGHVQGVGFRWFVKKTARSLGLSGWVANRPDGSVVCEAQGDAAPLADLHDALRRGPRLARVDTVDVQDCAPGDDEFPFAIR